MDDAYRYIASSYGKACAEALFVGNPGAVLAGEEVDAATPQAELGAKKWWRW